MRVSDSDRNRVVGWLNQAVGEGRLSLAEFEDRVDGVLAAVTQSDLARFTADLPAVDAPPVLELKSRASSLRRTGRWVVPRRLVITAQSSSVRVDLTDAIIAAPTVDLSLDVRSSSVKVVLPRGASADLHRVELSASTAKAKVPEYGGLHITVHGRLQSSSLKLRYQRRFLRWRW
jgi:hypothetical protein